MRYEAFVNTIDFGKNYFKVIILDKQLTLISSCGTIVTVKDDGCRTIQEQTEKAINKVTGFFKP